MKAIILAAGKSTRLYPLTNGTPKCLLKIGTKEIIQHQIDVLYRYGIIDIVVVVGYYGWKIREVLKDTVGYVENRDYNNTNSSYSLWLARKYTKDGFIYLNSDLVFHHCILKQLLVSKFENAMIVDKSKKFDEDMFKAIMKNNRILKLDKKIPSDIASAEGVGPVKFSKYGAAHVIDKIDEYLSRGDKGQWCYSIFSEVAEEINIFGVDAVGLPWVEVDTLRDFEIAQDLWLSLRGTANDCC